MVESDSSDEFDSDDEKESTDTSDGDDIINFLIGNGKYIKRK